MFAKASPDLKFRFIWLAIGYALVFFVVYLSLTSVPVDMGMSIPFMDKVYHTLAYFVLMAWFVQIYHDKFQRNMIALVFVVMGITLEYLQSFDPARFSEISDMVANTSGVALGLYLSLTGAKNCLLKIESFIG